MINLIKNEFIKIFKKKSTYIILAITIAMIILSNVIYKTTSNIFYSNYSSDMIAFYEEDLKDMNPNDPSTLSIYLEEKTQYDMLKLIEKYGFESWQANIIPQELQGYIYTINEYTYSSQKNETNYNEAKQKYNEIVKKLDTDDWKYFASSELEKVKEEIDFQNTQKNNTTNQLEINSIEENINHLEAQKQVLNWRLEKDISYANSFLNSCLENYAYLSSEIYSYEHTENHKYSEKQEYYNTLKEFNTNKYYIENDIKNISQYDNRGILLNLFSEYELFILIFIVMIAGSMISEEFNKGTIKLLLVRPYNRVKILLAKFIVCILSLLLFILVVASCQFIIGGIIQGFDSTSIPAVVYNFDTKQIETISIFKYILITAIAKLPMYLLLLTLSFACSTIFTNTPIAIVIPLLGYMGSELINLLAINYNIKLLTYFVTLNWDFTQYLFGGLPNYEGLTVPFSLIICTIYFVIMLITTFITFKKKNIKNI